MEFENYETRDGRKLVDDELDRIPSDKTKKRLARKQLFYEHKEFLQFTRGKELDKVPNTKLWEIKFRISPPYRALCILLALTKLLILHIFVKDYSDAIDQRDINIALEREKEYRSRHN